MDGPDLHAAPLGVSGMSGGCCRSAVGRSPAICASILPLQQSPSPPLPAVPCRWLPAPERGLHARLCEPVPQPVCTRTGTAPCHITPCCRRAGMELVASGAVDSAVAWLQDWQPCATEQWQQAGAGLCRPGTVCPPLIGRRRPLQDCICGQAHATQHTSLCTASRLRRC